METKNPQDRFLLYGHELLQGRKLLQGSES